MTVSNLQRRSRRFQKAQPDLWDFHQAMPTLALTALAAQVTPGLVKAIFPLRLKLAVTDCSGERERERKRPARDSPTNAWGAGPARESPKSHSSAPGHRGETQQSDFLASPKQSPIYTDSESQ